MWKIAAILLLAACCVQAVDEQPTKNDPPSASLLGTALCYIDAKPMECIKEQAGRVLNQWDQTIDEKKHELMVEADEELKQSETSRGLTDEEKKQPPSEMISQIDRGFSALANLLTNGDDDAGRESRALKSQKKQVDDDTNDFNDDYSIYSALNKAEGKGKKGKKGKKGIMKMFFFGAILKSKIELLLKVLSFHLQLKFFAVAVAGLMINLARFWIEVKRQPQKVVHIEHAQHQHHYDEHDDWGNNWKRQSEQDNYQQQNTGGVFAHRLAYNSQYPQQH